MKFGLHKFLSHPRNWMGIAMAGSSLGLLMVITGMTGGSLPAIAEEPMVRTLTVTGQGDEAIPTTLARVNLGVQVEGDTAAAAQQEAARRSTAVVEFLRSQSVAKLETTGIQLNPNYNYESREQQITGYTASNTVQFQVPTDRVGTILDQAVEAGATRIDSVSFIAEDPAIADARETALQEATRDALQQADVVLASLGLQRQDIVSIQVGNANVPPPIPFMAEARLAADSAPSTPVVGGEQTVEASVTLQIRY